MITTLLNRLESRGAANLGGVIWGLRAGGAVTAVLILCGGWFGHQALEQCGASLRDQYAAAESSIKNADSIHSQHDALESQVSVARSRNQAAASRIPASANEVEFLRQISGIARQSQLDIREFRPGATSEFATHSEMEFFIRGEGDFASLCRFIASVEEMPRVCRISQMTVSAPSQTSGTSQIELHIALAFGLKPPSST